MVQLLLASEAKQSLSDYISRHSDILADKFLAIIYVGDNSSSASYVRMKKKFGEKHGIETRIYGQEEEQTLETLTDLIHDLNTDDRCAGIMIQLPLPSHLQPYATKLCSLISPQKDVDGLGGQLLGLSTIGVRDVRPATP
ncbi:MAG: hypothetical protein CSA81_13895 [Acidobacteria bacterium]|nr:MAG: hypothetical protein CSA81_13895 [Acidobacteriota bacterium]